MIQKKKQLKDIYFKRVILLKFYIRFLSQFTVSHDRLPNCYVLNKKKKIAGKTHVLYIIIQYETAVLIMILFDR